MISWKELYRSHVEELTKNSQLALRETDYDQLVIHSGRLLKKSQFDDQDFPLRTVPMFEWWTDLQWSDSAIIVGKNREPELIALRSKSFWERPKEPNWEIIRSGLEVTEVTELSELKNKIEGSGRTAYIGHGEDVVEHLDANVDHLNPSSLIEKLHDCRATKTIYEIECMAEANRIGARGHDAIEKMFRAGVRSELQLHLEYLKASHQDDSETPYKNIVALGDAAAILHHMHYRNVPEAKTLLVDAGASFRRYPSDITRTYVIKEDTEETNLFENILSRMEILKQELCNRVKVGDYFEDLHNYAHEEVGRILIDLDIVRCSLEETLETNLTRKFFPHGLGHSIGIQVHDVGCLKRAPKERNKWLRNTTKMTPYQVFTIEPGLYFIDTLLEELKESEQSTHVDWKKIQMMKPYGGIRVEDNIVVLPEKSEEAFRNLTREAFAEL